METVQVLEPERKICDIHIDENDQTTLENEKPILDSNLVDGKNNDVDQITPKNNEINDTKIVKEEKEDNSTSQNIDTNALQTVQSVYI